MSSNWDKSNKNFGWSVLVIDYGDYIWKSNLFPLPAYFISISTFPSEQEEISAYFENLHS